METGSISWSRGTQMILTLQIDGNGQPAEASSETVAIQAEVVRTAPDGMGVRFLFNGVQDRRALITFLSKWHSTPKPAEQDVRKVEGSAAAVARSMFRRATGRQRAASEGGQSLTEFAALFPLLFLLVVNVVNFGTFMYAWITVANATRAGSQYFITGGATVFAPSVPTESQVATVISNDIATLPNSASLVVEVCTNNHTSGTSVVSCSGNYKTITPPLDAEPGNYSSATVDVKYTYQPAIALWPVPGLNINATIPTTTIHRQVVMRVMN